MPAPKLEDLARSAKVQGGAPRLEDLRAVASASQPQLAGVVGGPEPSAPAPQIAPEGRGEALARGGLQGASFGFGDELAGGVGALIGSDPLLGQTFDAPTLSGRYEQARDFYAAKNRGAQAQYPGSFLLGQLAGGVATPGLSTVANVGKLSNAARIAALSGAGATTGALTGAGTAEPGERIAGAERGAVVGALAAPALDTVVRAAGAASGAIARGARKAAGAALSRVAGGIQRDVSPAGGAAKFVEAGLEGYRRGLIRPLEFFGAAERQSDRVSELLQGSGQEIEQALQGGGSVALGGVKDAIVEATSKLRQTPNLNSSKLAEIDRLFKDLDELSGDSGQLSASQLQTAKEAVNDLIKSWDPGRLVGRADKALERTRKQLYAALSGQQEDAVGQTAGALEPYLASKASYGLAKTLTGFQESSERRAANQLAGAGGLHGSIGGVAGLMHALSTGDPLGGAAIYAGTRTIASPRAHALAALAVERAASALPAYAQSALNPLVARSAAQSIVAALNNQGAGAGRR